MVFRFRTEIWRYSGESAWHFATLPAEVSDQIRDVADEVPRGFGSVRVRASIGSSVWKTSVFPEKKSGCYILPVKKAIRKAHDLEDGDSADVMIEIQIEIDG